MSGMYVAEQVCSLRKRGVEVDVLFVNGVEEGKAAYLAGFRRVRAQLRAARYDLIHAHYVFSGILVLGQTLPPRPGPTLPVVLTQHGIETQMGWTAPLCRWTSRRVDCTIATSERVRAALGLPGVVIAPCGVDTELFRPMPQAEARAMLGLPPQARLVLFVGMRRPEKRLDLIEAAVASTGAAATGRGEPAPQLLVADREPHERIPFYMNAADALILASEAEGSPMVIKEAMACNLPIVSVDVGDVAEVTRGVAGCFVVERSAAALQAGVEAALAFGKRTDGRAAIMPLSLDAIAAQIETIYRETIASRRGS
jgi:glycosyltransferase involved in cell wall biosynthesis